MEGEGRIPTTQSHDDHMGSVEADDEEGEDGTLVAADASLVHALLEGEPSADDETHFDLERFAPRSCSSLCRPKQLQHFRSVLPIHHLIYYCPHDR